MSNVVSSPLEVGLLIHTRSVVGGSNTPADFDELWRGAARAEEAGFDHVWLGPGVLTSLERPGAESLATMAALAVRTTRIKIGVIPFLPALWNPVLLAHALATVDVISGGRLVLGVGVAPLAEHIERAFSACGVPYHQKAGRLSECIRVMRSLWTERTVTFQGKYYQFDEIGLLPKPAQSLGIPIWIAAGTAENALKRVVRLGDGWFSSMQVNDFLMCRQKIEAYAKEFGRKDPLIPAALYAAFNLNADSNAAREEGWAYMERFFRQPRSKQRHLAFFGTPQECAKMLARYKEAGVKIIVARLASDNIAHQMKLFLGELKPLLVP